MKITITETNETAELSITDPKSGCDWTNDLLGNHDSLPGNRPLTNQQERH